MIAADSSSIIAFLQNNKGKDVLLIEEALKNSQLTLPPPVLAELLSDPKLPKQISKFIIELPLLEMLPEFWERAGKLRALILSKKLKARLADTLIAQFCIDHHVSLITRDHDFQSFEQYTHLELLI